MRKIMLALGTRPELIKLAPLHRALKERSGRFKLCTCLTGQHRSLIDPLLDFFEVKPDFDLNVFKENQTLFDVTAGVLSGMGELLSRVKPDMLVVQGDTTSAFAAALAAFYLFIPVGHVEAGLRSFDRFQPYPEEANRCFISKVADLNFCPTPRAAENLFREGVKKEAVHVTGNTVIDALLATAAQLGDNSGQKPLQGFGPGCERFILVTGHRRENFSGGLAELSKALVDLVQAHEDTGVVYSLHPNPNVRRQVGEILGGRERIRIIPPPDYLSFVSLMKASYFIITDSGGIQEEAPSLKKPVLIARNVTERPEAVECGAARLVGSDRREIVRQADRLLADKAHYQSMIVDKSPFGDGKAGKRIVGLIEDFFAALKG